MQQETLRDRAVPCGLVGRGTSVSAYAQVERGVVKDVVQSSIWRVECRLGERSR
jgi:hypothetical protein